MDGEYIREPKDGLVTYGPDVVEEVRRFYNFHKKEDREKAISIIYEWLETQDHIVKKDFNKGYIERCILTSKASIERAKKQIDRICTVRTLMPKYFQTTNLKESDIMRVFEKAPVVRIFKGDEFLITTARDVIMTAAGLMSAPRYIAILPKLTKELYRVVLIRLKPNAETKAIDFPLFYQLLTVMAEYFKSNDFCLGFIMVCDIYDGNAADVLSKVNLVELQQFIPIITEGYGCKIKGIYLVTASKFVEGFIRLVKPLFSEKIGSRINAVLTRSVLQDLIHGDVLPKEYGGSEKSTQELNDDLVEVLTSKPMQGLLKEMNKAVTDESKRHLDKFNDQYMGMPGTFRTLSLD